MDYRRLAINLVFFFVGILIPLLAFQSAFGEYCVDAPDFSGGNYRGVLTDLQIRETASKTDPLGWRFNGDLYYFSGSTRYEFDVNLSSSSTCAQLKAGDHPDILITTTYPYVPPEASHCSNQIKDPGEDGIDCGGVCSSVCDLQGCPPGTDYYYGSGCFPNDPPWDMYQDGLGNCAQGTVDVSQDSSVKICVPYQIVPDADGNCREGYDIAYALAHGQELCGPETVLYSSDDSPPTMDEYSLEDENGGFVKGSLSIVENENTEITDNGDGTSTKVETITRSGSDGSSQTSTKTSIVDNSTGDTLASSTNTETETPPEDNPENYNYDIGSYELPGAEYDTVPDEKDLDSIFDQVQTWNPFSDADDRWKIVTSGSSCTLETNISFLGSHTLGFSLCKYQWAFTAIGVVMVFGAYLLSFFIVTKGR